MKSLAKKTCLCQQAGNFTAVLGAALILSLFLTVELLLPAPSSGGSYY